MLESTIDETLLMKLHRCTGSPDAARAAVRQWVDEMHAPEWDAVRDRRDACTARRDAIDDAIVWCQLRIAGPTLLRPDDTGVPSEDVLIDARANIVLGDLARVASQHSLTTAEATAWAASSTWSPAAWLLAEHGLSGTTEHVPVARWAVRMAESPRRRAALEKSRTIGGVDGSALARLDEMLPCDLSASVVGTMEAAARRIVREAWDGPDELAKPARWESQLPPGCTRLRTFLQLHAEGQQLRHCVGTDSQYAQGVMAGEHEILSLDVGGERATALITRDGVRQCSGPSNEAPSERMMDAARAAARVISWGRG